MSESSASESATQNKTAPIMDEKYRCGTLQYTKLGLFSLFGWMIMANLCFGLFEGNGGAGSIPFYLQDNFHISNTMVSILFNFIPMIIGTFMTPIVSFWSDRTRTRCASSRVAHNRATVRTCSSVGHFRPTIHLWIRCWPRW